MKIAAALFLLLGSSAATGAERRYTVPDFDRLLVEGPFKVTVTTGGPSHATAIGSPSALDRITVENRSGTLRIRADAGTGRGETGPVEVRVTTRQLRSAAMAGSGSLDVEGVKGLRFDVTIAGSGSARIGGIEADRLNVSLSGAGVTSLQGRAKVLEATVLGAAALAGSSLSAEDVRVAAATSGNVALGARRTAQVTSSGSGDVAVTGKPACTVKASGAGAVRCGS